MKPKTKTNYPNTPPSKNPQNLRIQLSVGKNNFAFHENTSWRTFEKIL
jgi:hypothetical protein